MQTKQKQREDISLLMDGEKEADELDSILSKLKDDEVRDDWEIYHRIGEMLRSGDTGPELSDGFFGKLQARLEREPIHSKDEAKPEVARNADENIKEGKHPDASTTRWVLSGIIASAAASTALIMTPQIQTAPAFGAGVFSALSNSLPVANPVLAMSGERVKASMLADEVSQHASIAKPAFSLDGVMIAWHDSSRPDAKK